MAMDKEWLKFYEKQAFKKVPEFMKGHWTKDGYRQLLRVTLGIVRNLNDVTSALDVGCGVGRYCFEISKMGIKVKGVDYSPSLIEVAKTSYPNLDFEVQNGYSLNFKDKSFDLVFSIGALQCLEDYKKFVSELCRVSSKYIVISTLLSHEKIDLDKTLQEALVDDTWPTRDYHPQHLAVIFENNGFKTSVITHEKGAEIKNGFFIIAKRQ